jgi:hypothetical protein
MAEDVYMDVPAVQQIGNTFTTIGDTLKKVASIMDAAAKLLETVGWLGGPGAAAVGFWLDQMQPVVNNLGTMCEEAGQGITGAIKAYQDGDFSGSQQFVG